MNALCKDCTCDELSITAMFLDLKNSVPSASHGDRGDDLKQEH